MNGRNAAVEATFCGHNVGHMGSITPRSMESGFGLAEALVALLLLAIATIGAGAAMVESLAAQRAALLRTQAADLAADLAEALRSSPDASAQEAEILSWQTRVLSRLPRAEPHAVRQTPSQSITPSMLPAGIHIRLQWRDGRAPSLSLLVLPIAIGNAQEGS
jgi:general secretion pathway protein I